MTNTKERIAEALLPCPFCNSAPDVGSLGGDNENWLIWCKNCNKASCETGVDGEELEDIAKAWNTRAMQPDIQKLVDALRRIQADHDGLVCDLGITTQEICEQALANIPDEWKK